MGAAVVAQVALPSVWLGAVASISFMEAPLKFRAPGVTLPVAVGIGRLVFRALNRLELVLAVGLAIAVAEGPAPGAAAWSCMGLLWGVLLAQTLWLRPRLDARARALLAGRGRGRPRLHQAYVALEVAKAALLVAVALLLGTSAG